MENKIEPRKAMENKIQRTAEVCMTVLNLTDAVSAALNDLYTAFIRYRVSDLKTTTCFDFGPDEAELAGISLPLREIPDETLSHMEFFGDGWDSWGTKEEVKYFLPRLMEYVARDIRRLEDPGTFSLFKYKLRDFECQGVEIWTTAEKKALQVFLEALLEQTLGNTEEVENLLEAALAAGFGEVAITAKWESKGNLLVAQMARCLKHFRYQIGDASLSPRGSYFDDPKRIAKLLDLRFSQMSEKEAEELLSRT